VHLRVRTLSVLVAGAALLLPLLGAASAQAAAHNVRPVPPVVSAPASVREPNCSIKPYPKLFVETGLGTATSSIAFVLQVACEPVFAEQKVQINAQQVSNEFPSVYAENEVQFSDPQLAARCNITWIGPDEVPLGTGSTVTTR
jgi:hypothetical protein